MQLFLDTVDIDVVREAKKTGLVAGITTNPTLLSKTSGRPHDTLRALCEIAQGPVSAEVTTTDPHAMLGEAIDLADIHDNIVVKLPATEEGFWTLRKLRNQFWKRHIPVNVTLVFDQLQTLRAAQEGAAYVSPFLGRFATRVKQETHSPKKGMEAARILVEQSVKTVRDSFHTTKILAASISDLELLRIAAAAGAHYATLPPDIFWEYVHLAPEMTKEGQRQFLEDWRARQTN